MNLDLGTTIALSGLVITFFIAVLTGVNVWIAKVIHESSQRQARAQYQLAMQELWNTANVQALASPKDTRMAHWLFSSDRALGDIDRGRASYFTFIVLNSLHTAFMGRLEGVIDPAYADANLNHLLSPIVLKDDLFELTQSRGYHSGFSEFCMKLREQKLREQELREQELREQELREQLLAESAKSDLKQTE